MAEQRAKTVRKESRKKENESIVRMKQFYPSQCLFLVPNKSFRHKRETSDSNVVTVLNSMPPEMYPTGRRVKQRALQGMNVVFSAAVCSLLFFPRLFFPSHPFIPGLLFHLTSSVYFLSSALHQGHYRRVSPVPRCNSDFVCSSPFQIISLLNVFTPQKSLEEFQDV